jgi:hypothetical protein
VFDGKEEINLVLNPSSPLFKLEFAPKDYQVFKENG